MVGAVFIDGFCCCFVTGFLLTILGFLIPVILVINFLASNASRDLQISLLGKEGTNMLFMYLVNNSIAENRCCLVTERFLLI